MSIDIKSKEDKARIKAWIREENGSYDVVIKLLGLYIAAVQGEEITGENEFQTLRTLHINKGKVDGVKEFFNMFETAGE